MLSLCELKSIACFSVCNQRQNYNQKLYTIPIRTASVRVRIARSSVGSLECDGTGPHSDAYSGFSAPNDHQRWELVQMILFFPFFSTVYACCIFKYFQISILCLNFLTNVLEFYPLRIKHLYNLNCSFSNWQCPLALEISHSTELAV